MATVTKPIPDHHFHEDPDHLLASMIRVWREKIDAGEEDEETLRSLMDKAYKVLGYRCALEYLKKYDN